MVDFGTGYFMPMDREYGHQSHAHDNCGHDHGHSAQSGSSTGDVGVGIKDLGVSAAFGPVPNVHAMNAKIRGGAKTLEIGFFGYGKGSGQGQTPETFGKLQRQALAETGRANKVNFTTHTSVGVYGLAGMDQQGNFNKQGKEMNIQEIRRAIEFAADVGQGGPVVVHTGEFQRAVVEAEWNKGEDNPYAGKFKMYEGEEERASFRVVDSRTGGVIQEARRNRAVTKPVWRRADRDYEGMNEDGKPVSIQKGDYIDYFGRQLKREHRVPEFDDENQKFKTTQVGWEELKVEAEEMTKEARDEWRKWRNTSSAEERKKMEEKSPWSRFMKDEFDEKSVKIRPEEAYILATLETNAANSRGWAYYYGGDFKEIIDNINILEKARRFYDEAEQNAVTEEEKEKYKRKLGQLIPGIHETERGEMNITQIIDRQLSGLKLQMRRSQESASSQWSQAEEAKETMKYVESAETYALREAYDAYAQAAVTAMRHSDALSKENKLKKPIAVALENLFPESYGAHPEELIQLVEKSRKTMIGILTSKEGHYRMSEEEARKKAEAHITATFDTGHLNMWRKYWRGNPEKSIQENDDAFDKWTIDQVKKMVKANIIGHVHLDDNYGYQDEHLAPGEGNTPIKDMVRVLKEAGYKGELIVEPGADYSQDVSGFHSVMKTWKLFGSSVYGAGSGFAGRRSWGQVGSGSFGYGHPPYFTFGAYSPSEDWTLWSGVPLE